MTTKKNYQNHYDFTEKIVLELFFRYRRLSQQLGLSRVVVPYVLTINANSKLLKNNLTKENAQYMFVILCYGNVRGSIETPTSLYRYIQTYSNDKTTDRILASFQTRSLLKSK